MKSNSSLFHDRDLHFSKKEISKWINMGKLIQFLLFSLGLTSIFSYFILNYSPNPSNIKSNQDPIVDLHNHHHNNIHNNVIDQPVGTKTDTKSVSTNSHNGDDKCDLFTGHWIPDMRGSLYTNFSCPTIPVSKNCFMHGRMDKDFVNWRWRPDGCDLPRFEPKIFLEFVRGKKLAFIGDSVARNHMESLLCLLSQEETPKDIFRDSEDRFRTWYFTNHDFTLKVIWTKFLIKSVEREINGSLSGIYDLHIDKIENRWADELPALDFAIISTAHWFFRQLYIYTDNKITGCVYCSDQGIKQVSSHYTIQMALRRSLDHVNKCKECNNDMVTVIRTFSPAHFENGTWNTGGSCNRDSPINEGDISLENYEWELRTLQVEEVQKAQKAEKERRIRLLDITRAMLMRPDGHPSSHWDNQYMKGFNDCVHWCLPGPIDAWNDLLLAVLRKETDSSSFS